jgi:uncharacterized protein (DUF2147 family)
MRNTQTRNSTLAGLVLAGLVLGSSTAAPQQQRAAMPTVQGVWEQVDEKGKVGSWFYIYERDGLFEGKLVKLFPRPGEKPNPICTKCQGEQKNMPTLGLTLIKGMQRNGRLYEKGTILDPRDGSIYSARMELSPDGQKLLVRGFLGIDLFGQSQIWRRLPDSVMNEVTGSIPSDAAANAPNGRRQPVRR